MNENAVVLNNQSPAEIELNQMTGVFSNTFDSGDRELPRIKVAQLDAKFDETHTHGGHWFNTLDGEFVKEVRFIPIYASKQRQMFVSPFDPDIPTVCASMDFITPLDKYIGEQVTNGSITAVINPGECAECPFSQWGYDEVSGKSIVPLCSETYVYVGYDIDKRMPFGFRLQRGAIKAGKKLNTLASVNSNAVLIAKTEFVKGKKDYFTPAFAMLTRNFFDLENGSTFVEDVVSLRKMYVNKAAPIEDEDNPF
jgi:hypothetical protein